jgi:hypothetical protein
MQGHGQLHARHTGPGRRPVRPGRWARGAATR